MYKYGYDKRSEAANKTRPDFDPIAMVLSIEITNSDGDEITLEFPAKYAVCPVCEGKGTHVNPSVDDCGLSREDFDEDPDFEREYFAGAYDVTCYGCDGQRVAPEIDTDKADKADLKAYRQWEREEREYQAMCRAERMLGA